MPTAHPTTGQPDGESLLTCPYNPSHRVAAKRFQFHITKCRKGHPNAKKESCPYNATHMVNEQEFQFHVETCLDRKVIDNFMYATPNENAHLIELPPEPVVPPNEENWDNEYCGTYDPSVKTAEAPIIHSFIGGTPSERKKCRVLQRQKFRALDESATSTTIVPKVEKYTSDDQPLRPPKTLPSSHANYSTPFASLNQSFASGVSEASVSTSNNKRNHVSTGSGSDEDKIPNLVPANAWTRDRPGRPQPGPDDFMFVRTMGRGKHTQKYN